MARWTLPEGKIYTQADLDRALAAERERCAKVADSYNEDPYPQTEYDRGWARSAQDIAAAIRAQKL